MDLMLRRRSVRAVGVLFTAAAVAELGLIYLGQTDGSTPEERRKPLCGDGIVPNPVVASPGSPFMDAAGADLQPRSAQLEGLTVARTS
jgi:hypothetical protein